MYPPQIKIISTLSLLSSYIYIYIYHDNDHAELLTFLLCYNEVDILSLKGNVCNTCRSFRLKIPSIQYFDLKPYIWKTNDITFGPLSQFCSSNTQSSVSQWTQTASDISSNSRPVQTKQIDNRRRAILSPSRQQEVAPRAFLVEKSEGSCAVPVIFSDSG